MEEMKLKWAYNVVTLTTLVDFDNSIGRLGPKTFRNRIVKPNLKRLYSVCYNKQAFLGQILIKEITPKWTKSVVTLTTLKDFGNLIGRLGPRTLRKKIIETKFLL